jgi:hypothetical protein
MILSIIPFLFGLALPLFYSSGQAWYFSDLFLSGLGFFPDGYFWAIANLFLLSSWVVRGYPRLSGALAWGALLLGLSFLVQDHVTLGVGNRHVISSYGMGYWLWCLSPLISACLVFRITKGCSDGMGVSQKIQDHP